MREERGKRDPSWKRELMVCWCTGLNVRWSLHTSRAPLINPEAPVPMGSHHKNLPSYKMYLLSHITSSCIIGTPRILWKEIKKVFKNLPSFRSITPNYFQELFVLQFSQQVILSQQMWPSSLHLGKEEQTKCNHSFLLLFLFFTKQKETIIIILTADEWFRIGITFFATFTRHFRGDSSSRWE